MIIDYVNQLLWNAERRLIYVLVSSKFILNVIKLQSNDYFTLT
jgi:hypothetical protein